MSKDLVEAAKNGNLDRVNYNVNHLSVHIDSRHPPVEGPTALYWAACNGYEKICDWLIRHKADPNVILPSSGSTPLHAAADRGHYNCVLCLISSGSEVNRQTTNNGDTALHLAAYRNYPSISRLLLEHGASLMLVNKQDRTPLDEACLKNNVEVIQLLTKRLGSGATLRDPSLLEGSSKNRSFYYSDDRIGIQPFDIGPEQTQSILSEPYRHQVFDEYETTSLSSCSFNNFTPSSHSSKHSTNSSKPPKNSTKSERIAELEALVKTLTEDVANKNLYISSLRRENESLKKKLGLHEDFRLNKS